MFIQQNGALIEIQNEGTKIVKLKEKAASNILTVDGSYIGELQDVVIKDRQMLAKDGIFIIVAILNPKTGKLKKSPDIISRGFVYLQESQDLLNQARMMIKKTIEEEVAGMNPINLDFVKNDVARNVRRLLFQKTGKKPIVFPVISAV